MRGSMRIVGLLAAVGIGVVVLVGCGSSGYSGPNIAKGLSAAQLQARSAAQTAALRSYVVGINGTAAIAVPPAALGTTPAAPVFSGKPVPISATGPVVAPNAFSLAATISVAGTTVPFTLTQVGGHVYVVEQQRALLLPTKGPVVNITSVITGTIRAMTAPAIGPTTTIGGVPSIEVSGGLNGAAVARSVAPLLTQLPGAGSAAPSAAATRALAAALSRGTVHEWVRVSDLRPARVELAADIPDGAAISHALTRATIDLTFGLSEFNTPQQITAPPNAVPISKQALGQLI